MLPKPVYCNFIDLSACVLFRSSTGIYQTSLIFLQVFWFTDINAGPSCQPDPCGGLNLNRGPNDLPFLPSQVNGKCFQMGAVSYSEESMNNDKNDT